MKGFEIFPEALLGVLGAAGFADDVDPDLAGILHLLLDGLGDLLRQNADAVVVDILGLDHDAHLAAALDGVALFDALEAVGNLFQLLQPLDVVLQALPAGAGPGRGNRVRRL